MHKMPDYRYYKDVFQGTVIPQSAFPGLIARVEGWIRRLERNCRVEPYGEDSWKMALCALAETLYFHGGKEGVAQTSVGGVSVRYAQGGVPLQRLLLEAAAGYLEVYRGVS